MASYRRSSRCLATLLVISSAVKGFVTPYVQKQTLQPTFSSTTLQANREIDDDNDDCNITPMSGPSSSNLEGSVAMGGGGGPEKSQMSGFIADFLKRENNADNKEDEEDNTNPQEKQEERFTHLIAIPMGSCHELAIELESVQRAILYHCPVLVHTCLVPATTRLPLLYVEAPSTTSSQQATEALHRIVQEVVQKHVFVVSSSTATTAAATATTSTYTGTVDDEIPLDGVNSDGVRPLTLTFQSLEVDGPNNQALHTVALPDDPGTVRLQDLVAELQNAIATQLDWETQIPPDEHIVNTKGGKGGVPPVFRPRVPFMRIPPNYQDYLDPLPEGGEELFRSADQGGNGISPIFWSTWWDDVFGMARLREIGIYPRTSTATGGLGEDAFHIPQQLTLLPDGNEALTKEEAKFEAYQDQRMKQAEYDAQLDQEQQRGLAESQNSPDNVMFEKTQERLKELYKYDIQEMEQAGLVNKEDSLDAMFKEDPKRPKVDTTLLDEWTQERIRKANAAKGITMYDDEEEDDDEQGIGDDREVDAITKALEEAEKPKTPNNNKNPEGEGKSKDGEISITSFDDASDQLDEWTRNRIRQAVDSREYVKARESLAIKKDKVPFKDNPILKAYKEGTLVPESQQSKDSSSKDLPPFPARENFVGFWEVLNSPTGFPPDDPSGDESRSENLVLRVDGTTSGGPILDPETQQKAAGGTWKVTPNEDGDGDDATAQLRIRLVIPPKKERILVLQGTAKQAPVLSLNEMPPMASSTFGIPELEEKVRRAREAEQKELSDLLEDQRIRASGKVWLEDAITGKNKVEIGEFALAKLNTPRDRSQYTITIPKPIRTQD